MYPLSKRSPGRAEVQQRCTAGCLVKDGDGRHNTPRSVQSFALPDAKHTDGLLQCHRSRRTSLHDATAINALEGERRLRAPTRPIEKHGTCGCTKPVRSRIMPPLSPKSHDYCSYPKKRSVPYLHVKDLTPAVTLPTCCCHGWQQRVSGNNGVSLCCSPKLDMLEDPAYRKRMRESDRLPAQGYSLQRVRHDPSEAIRNDNGVAYQHRHHCHCPCAETTCTLGYGGLSRSEHGSRVMCENQDNDCRETSPHSSGEASSVSYSPKLEGFQRQSFAEIPVLQSPRRCCDRLRIAQRSTSVRRWRSASGRTENGRPGMAARQENYFFEEDSDNDRGKPRSFSREHCIEELRRLQTDLERKELFRHKPPLLPPGKASASVTALLNLRKETHLLSPTTDESGNKLDVLLMKKALRTIALENAGLKERLAQAKEKSDELVGQLCEELELRSTQSRTLTTVAQDLRSLQEAVQHDTSLPSWIEQRLSMVLGALEGTTSASSRSITASRSTLPNGTSATRAERPLQKFSPISSCVKPDIVDQEMTQGALKQSHLWEAENDAMGAVTTTTTATGDCRTTVSDNAPASEAKRDVCKSKSISKSSSSSPLSYSDDDWSDPETPLSKSGGTLTATITADRNLMTTDKTVQSRHPVPLLCLKENNIGCGSWLSGEMTQGDTYSAAQ